MDKELNAQKNPATPEAEVIPSASADVEFINFTEAMKGLVEPFAKSQETSQIEATKRVEIISKLASRLFLKIFVIGVLVIILAGIALFRGNIQLTEKIIIALFAFLGGMGFGRFISKQ